MKKTVYTKYSTDRGDNFKIATSILKDENGDRWVEKRAIHKKAKPHIDSLSWKFKELKQYYEKAAIEPVSCEMSGSTAVFSFVEGTKLESRLDKYVGEKDFKNILGEIENYKKLITSNVELLPFQVCDEFIHVFGTDYPKEERKSFRISDIDLIFSNIIITDNRWNVIDYEWTFDFPVPVDFVIYRAIKIYVGLSAKRKILIDSNIYGYLGISERDRVIYDNMESSFLSYVLGEQELTWKLYENMRGRNIYLYDIIEKNINPISKNEIQIFCDTGNGYSEENSYKVFRTFSRPIDLELKMRTKINGFRIDIGSRPCVVKVVEAVGSYKGFYNVNISNNGVDIGNSCYVFPNEDPQIYINGLRENTVKVIVKLEVKIVEQSIIFDLCKAISGFYDKINQLSADNQDMNRQHMERIAQLEEKIHVCELEAEQVKKENQQIKDENQQIENENQRIKFENDQKQEMLDESMHNLEILLHSTSWKITKPYRILGEWIKKCLGKIFKNA